MDLLMVTTVEVPEDLAGLEGLVDPGARYTSRCAIRARSTVIGIDRSVTIPVLHRHISELTTGSGQCGHHWRPEYGAYEDH